MNNIAIIYWSGTGNTETMAEAIAKGVEASGHTPLVINVDRGVTEDLSGITHYALGCPSMGAEVLEESSFEPFYEAIKSTLGGKKVALFGSYGWGDGEWMRNWESDVDDSGANLFETGLILNETPDGEGIDTCIDFGKRFAAF